MGSDYEVVRTTTVRADPARVHALVDDFHRWSQWSPWEDLDPAMERTYVGPDSGVGARYAWRGNRKAGQGSMEITGSEPERVEIDLHFLKPFRSSQRIEFRLTPEGTDSTGTAATEVTWRMTGRHAGITGLVGRLVDLDRLVGRDFERGLARLKVVAES